jgi:hypothetical protein
MDTEVMYYRVLGSNEEYEKKNLGTAIANNVGKEEYFKLTTRFFELPSKDVIIPSFTLIEGYYADYLGNDLGWNMCSEQLMKVINSLKSDLDVIDWKEVQIYSEQHGVRPYYALFFPQYLHALDEEQTVYASGMIWEPALKKDIIKNHHIFKFKRTHAFVISERIKEDIVSNGLSGMSFDEVKVV